VPDETGEALDARARVVEIARGELGPQDPDKYWAVVCPALVGHEHTIAWCGGFALWCLREAGLTDLSWVVGKGFVGHLRSTALPEPGDVAVFGAPLWHHAIVTGFGDGHVETIDGNTMPFPLEGVTAKRHPITPAAAFYSIASLIS
jgi:hypothetical protein